MYDDPEYLHQGYSTMSSMIEKFKLTWQKDYLTALREKHSTVSVDQVVPVKVGDIVIAESTTARENWPLARVTKLLPDSRGQVRAVEVFVDGQLLVKTLNKLVKLEVSGEVTNDNTPNQTLPGDLTAGSGTDMGNESGTGNNGADNLPTTESPVHPRPRRAAATRARDLYLTFGQQDLI